MLNQIDSIKKMLCGTQRHLLVGNGLSCALPAEEAENMSKPYFHLESIINSIECEKVKKLIQEYKNTETAIDALEQVLQINKILGNDNNEYVEEALANIKYEFVLAVAKIHPDSAKSIDRKYFENLFTFIKNFHSIFTLNYDLLLYWTLLFNGFPDSFKDGFFQNKWNNDGLNIGKANVFYLHGALFFWLNDQSVVKSKIGNTEPTVCDITSKLKHSRPLIVAESTAKAKMKFINNETTGYLSFCFKKLSEIKGDLVTYGCSFKNDDHILNNILENKSINNIFFGFQGGVKNVECDFLSAKIKLHLKKKHKK